MNQDGNEPKGPSLLNTPPRSASDGRGKLILTLCVPTGTRRVYPRVVVPFPESRQAAIKAALLAFKPFLPSNTKRVAIGLTVDTHDGDTQWAQISSNDDSDWREVVSPGNEVGVFLMGGPEIIDVLYISTQTVPNKPRPGSILKNVVSKQPSTSNSQTPEKKLLHVSCTLEGQKLTVNVMITTNSYQECKTMLIEHFKDSDSYSTSGSVQISAQVESDGKKVWYLIGDSASFSRLLETREEPVKLRAQYSSPGIHFKWSEDDKARCEHQ